MVHISICLIIASVDAGTTGTRDEKANKYLKAFLSSAVHDEIWTPSVDTKLKVFTVASTHHIMEAIESLL